MRVSQRRRREWRAMAVAVSGRSNSELLRRALEERDAGRESAAWVFRQAWAIRCVDGPNERKEECVG